MLNLLPLSAVPSLYAHLAVSRAVVTPSPHLPAPCCAFRLICSRASRFRFLRGESRPTSEINRAQARSGKTLFRVSVPRSLGVSCVQRLQGQVFCEQSSPERVGQEEGAEI